MHNRAMPGGTATGSERLTESLFPVRLASRGANVLGVFPGDGVGPEVIAAALAVAEAVGGVELDVRFGGPIGTAALEQGGTALPEDAVGFCEGIFAAGGAILNGPGCGRYVYDLRRRFELFLKLAPICSRNGLGRERFDFVVARENVGGGYQGTWEETEEAGGGRVVHHTTTTTEAVVRPFLEAAAAVAAGRTGRLAVVVKTDGLPGLSRLWRDCALDGAAAHGLEIELVDVDLMAYRLVAEPGAFDVVAAPNVFGDILVDLAAVLVGSRALPCSGNFTARGDGVFQTNHGAARDIAGTDRANPAGQIFSLAMLLRESFGLDEAADSIENAVRRVWGAGYRTAEVARPGHRLVGTRTFGELVAEAVAEPGAFAGTGGAPEAAAAL